MRDVVNRCHLQFSIDLFADRLGRTAVAPKWRFPGCTAFELDLRGECVWVHPPRALLQATFDHSNAALAQDSELRAVVLCPEDIGAPWFRTSVLRRWNRVQFWPSGSALFRVLRSDGSWATGPCTDLPYVLLQSWTPSRRASRRQPSSLIPGKRKRS